AAVARSPLSQSYCGAPALFRSLLWRLGAVERWRIREACGERGRLRPAAAAVALALARRVGVAGVLGAVLARRDHFLAGLGAHGAAAAGLDAVVRGCRWWLLRRCRLARRRRRLRAAREEDDEERVSHARDSTRERGGRSRPANQTATGSTRR